MDRREFITTIGAGVAAEFSGQPELTEDAVPTSESDNSVADLLPREASIPAGYTESTSNRWRSAGFRSESADVPDTDWLQYFYRRRDFGLGDGPELLPGHISVQVRLPVEKGDGLTTEGIDIHHRDVVRTAYGGNAPGEGSYTDWHDVELSDDEVDGYQQTLHCSRGPPAVHPCKVDYEFSEKPHHEYALLVQSTDWGVVEVEAQHIDEKQKGRQRRIVHQVLADILSRASLADRPTVDYERGR